MTSESPGDPEATQPLSPEDPIARPAEQSDGAAPPATRAGADRESQLALPAGHHLQEFVIESTIGEGGFGVVYLARDTRLDRVVAIKEFLPAAFASRTRQFGVSVRSKKHRHSFDVGRRSFINEARLLAQFDHPALVKVYRYWEENGTAYIAMPYYAGLTLNDWVHEQQGTVSEQRLLRVIDALCDPLEMLHAKGVFHRDIAPDNIRILEGDQPVLLDFGAARKVMADMTQALTVFFKAGYAPIEQYAEVASLRQGPWTDVYALSAVLYYCVTGRAPPAAAARMVKDECVPAVVAGGGRYSTGFLAAIDKGLVVRPERRTHTISEFRSTLGLPQAPVGPVEASSAPRPASQGARASPGKGTAATVNRKAPAAPQSPRSRTRRFVVGVGVLAIAAFGAARLVDRLPGFEHGAGGAPTATRQPVAVEPVDPVQLAAQQSISVAQTRISHAKEVLDGMPEAPPTLFQTADAALDDARLKLGSGQAQAAVEIATVAADDAERAALDFVLERELAYRQAADQSLKSGDLAAAESAVEQAKAIRARGTRLSASSH